jgi:hypothetical protein
MKGVTASAHYDSRTNYIAMVRGRKRYLLLPPEECSKLELFPRGHPSARHSQVLWSNLSAVLQHPQLANARATEVVLSMGEIMYLPSFWFHYIVSQDASIQCNCRSGESEQGKPAIEKCGFARMSSSSAATGTEAAEGRDGDGEEGDARDREEPLSIPRLQRLRRHRKKRPQGVDWTAMQ